MEWRDGPATVGFAPVAPRIVGGLCADGPCQVASEEGNGAIRTTLSHGSTAIDTDVEIALPPKDRLEQDDEWCVAHVDGEWRQVRFHDYDRIFEVEGLYECIFYDVLRCASPAFVRGELERELAGAGLRASDLRVLDLGAGNGIMGQELVDLGVASVVGADIIPEARDAAMRDRPDVYDGYHVVDMSDLADDERRQLADERFTALTCVAALGFGDIPPEAFAGAFNLVGDGGWIAFNIKDEFLNGEGSGFSRLIHRAIEEGTLDVRSNERYRHRDATNGDPIHYHAIVAVKRGDLQVAD